MLQFFRINDPYRLFFVALILLAFRVSLFLISAGEWTLNELNWLLLGEFLNEGNMLYKTTITDVAPFSAWTYQLLNLLFGQSQVALFITSYLLVLFQAYFFNALLLRNKVYNENTYIPAVLYAVFMTFSFDTLTLSPALMGITFVLLSLNNVLRRLDQTSADDLFSVTGVYLAAASLFYFPFVLFLPAVLMSLLILSNPKPRRIVLLLFSFLLTFLMVSTYFYYHSAFQNFWDYYISAGLTFQRIYLVDLEKVLLWTIPTILIAVFSTISTVFSIGYINSQKRVFYAFLIFQLFGFIAMVLGRKVSPHFSLTLAITGSFFLVHYLLTIRKKWLGELVFILSLLAVAVNAFIPLLNNQYDDFYASQKDASLSFEQKRLMVLDDDITYFRRNSFNGDFLDWKLSEPIFRRIQNIENLIKIEESILRNKPEIIIDPSGYMDAVLELTPRISQRYTRSMADNRIVELNEELSQAAEGTSLP